jgi:hypothetical protein
MRPSSPGGFGILVTGFDEGRGFIDGWMGVGTLRKKDTALADGLTY